MSRIRYLKPGFFLDEDLAECQPLARLLFAGLWTIADREGRLEDRPKRIKAALFPYEGCDVGRMLSELAKRGSIVRYEVDEERYIAIPHWHRHQRPHPREAASLIPAPPHPSTAEPRQGTAEQDLGVIEGLRSGEFFREPFARCGELRGISGC